MVRLRCFRAALLARQRRIALGARQAARPVRVKRIRRRLGDGRLPDCAMHRRWLSHHTCPLSATTICLDDWPSLALHHRPGRIFVAASGCSEWVCERRGDWRPVGYVCVRRGCAPYAVARASVGRNCSNKSSYPSLGSRPLFGRLALCCRVVVYHGLRVWTLGMLTTSTIEILLVIVTLARLMMFQRMRSARASSAGVPLDSVTPAPLAVGFCASRNEQWTAPAPAPAPAAGGAAPVMRLLCTPSCAASHSVGHCIIQGQRSRWVAD